MDASASAECKRRWDTAGWCVVEDVIPPDLLARPRPRWGTCSRRRMSSPSGADPERNAQFLTERGAPRPRFPFEHDALNQVALHDAVLDLAEQMLTIDDIRLYQAALTAKYANAAPDYEQLLHVDYANHTLVVPRTDVGYQHVTMFIYLSDVTPETGATRVVSREHTAGIPVERTYLHLDDYADLYAREESASGPAGSVFVYRPDVFHRGIPIARPGAARFLLPVAFKPAAADWIGFQSFADRCEDMAWHRFVRRATVRQLTVLGFPKPGDPYWTAQTLAGVGGAVSVARREPVARRGTTGVDRLGVTNQRSSGPSSEHERPRRRRARPRARRYGVRRADGAGRCGVPRGDRAGRCVFGLALEVEAAGPTTTTTTTGHSPRGVVGGIGRSVHGNGRRRCRRRQCERLAGRGGAVRHDGVGTGHRSASSAGRRLRVRSDVALRLQPDPPQRSRLCGARRYPDPADDRCAEWQSRNGDGALRPCRRARRPRTVRGDADQPSCDRGNRRGHP